MAIQVITNFEINASVPIDSRTVVSDINERNNIEYKFTGLKVFVESESKTYVYIGNTWELDGGGVGGGIYGGSGSLPGDVGIFLGTVSNNQDDRSNYLYFDSDGQTDGDKNFLYHYSYRRQTAGDWDSMSYRTEQKILPSGGGLRQGPFIEYNGLNPNDSSIVGGLNFGVVNSSGNKVIKVSLTSESTQFYSSEDPSTELPVSLSMDGTGNTVLGYNSSGDTFNDQSKRSYRLKFGSVSGFSSLNFDTKIESSQQFNTIFQINAENNPSIMSSNLGLLVDSSSRDWDLSSTRTPSLLTPQRIVRDISHKYTKTQIFGAGTTFNIENFILYLRIDGNSFEVDLPPNQEIRHIQAYVSPSIKPEFPKGTIINIKFKNLNNLQPGFLKIWNGASSLSKIKSDITDATFERNDNSKLTIFHNLSPIDSGDLITFRKWDQNQSSFWEIVNINREQRITNRNWPESISTEWIFNNRPQWLSATASSGRFQNFNGNSSITNSITSVDNPPNKWQRPTPGQNTIGPPRDVTNKDGFKFRMSVDGNRIVFAQGNFKIDVKGDIRNTTSGNNTRQFYYKSIDSRTNIWNIGQVNNLSLIPQWETAWTQVLTYCRGYYGANFDLIKIINPVFSINRLGEMFLSFDAEPGSNTQQYIQELLLEVWVPSFSYTAATFSLGSTTVVVPPPVTE